MMKWIFLTIFLPIVVATSLQAQTIAEKKAGTVVGSDLSPEMQKFLKQVNKELNEWKVERRRLYDQVWQLYQDNAPEDSYKKLLEKIREVQANIIMLENSWRQMASEASYEEEEYGLWHQPGTTLDQLIIDYGSHNYVYLMSSDIASITLSVNSNLPIPRASWDEMMDVIFAQNGVGIKQLNPYLRQLYFVKEDQSGIGLITNKREELEVLPGETRIAFMLTPEPSDTRRIWTFLDKFINPNSTVLQMIGRDILIVAPVSEIKEMMKLYDFVLANRGNKEYKAVSLLRIDSQEMARILAAVFDQLMEGGGGPPVGGGSPNKSRQGPPHEGGGGGSYGGNGLRVLTLAHISHAVFLIGTKEEIKKAEEIIHEVENQIGEAREKIVYTYVARHSDADELAGLLEKVYNLIISTGAGLEKKELEKQAMQLQRDQKRILAELESQPPLPEPLMPVNEYAEGYYLDDRFLVNPDPGQIREERTANQNRNNFIVDVKTGAIVMVVEADALTKLKELIRKLDVPKKMVQIECLLFEKRILKENNFGLNLLKIGTCATNTVATCAEFNVNEVPGIFTYMMSRKKTDSGIPAYDLSYRFLLAQDDITINASPSVVAVNQTTATIEIEEEISVSTGTFVIPSEGGSNPSLKDAFARARYGIVIEITPTIHMQEDDDCDNDDVPNYVTLDTDIKFETIHRVNVDPSRPPVTRRKITNQVRIEDGQTVILGGLRRKITSDGTESIPFLGELPGVGKLFGLSNLRQDSTEMFIFLTPRIISDPGEDMDRIRRIEMTRRPGDIPEFLCRLVEARDWERARLFQGTLNILFGPPLERCYSPYDHDDQRCEEPAMLYGEYDGR